MKGYVNVLLIIINKCTLYMDKQHNGPTILLSEFNGTSYYSGTKNKNAEAIDVKFLKTHATSLAKKKKDYMLLLQ